MKIYFIFFYILMIVSCSSTTNQGSVGVHRRQNLSGISSENILKKSEKSYLQIKSQAQQKNILDKNPLAYNRISKIADKLIQLTKIFRTDSTVWNWEYHIITNEEINAFCLPGGKIIIYSNLIDQLKLTDGEIAAVLGHEIAHALREHGREKMTTQMISEQTTRVGLALLVGTGSIGSGNVSSAKKKVLHFSNMLISIPHNRTQEFEADAIGIELMARAGYDPEQALNFWKKIGQQSIDKSQSILSTHPTDDDRLAYIQSLLPRVRSLYLEAMSYESRNLIIFEK